LHNLFQHLNESILNISSLSDIFSVMKPWLWKSQFNTADNSGNRLLDILEDACRRIGKKSFTKGESLVNTSVWNSTRDITQAPSLADSFAGMTSEEDLIEWLGNLPGSQPITWIDTLGDTPLTAMLKSELSATLPDATLGAIVERMVKLMGAGIHMRDRNGETALAIAARRGFHSVVTLLLELGANVHCRDYRGVGILARTENIHLSTKDEKRWAMIWSCRIALIDAGAKDKPTNQNEWSISSSKQREMLEARSPATRNPNGLWYPS
jgi:Ankyrin repeat